MDVCLFLVLIYSHRSLIYPSDELLFVHSFVINVINLPQEWFVRHVDVSCEERRASGCVSHCAGCWQLLAGGAMARMLCYPSGEASLQHLTNDWWPGSPLPVHSAPACTRAHMRTWPHAETERSPQLITAWHWPLHMCTLREATFHHFLVYIHNDQLSDLLPSLIFILLMEKNINYINTAFCELCFLQCFPSSCKFYVFLFSPFLLLLFLSFNSGPSLLEFYFPFQLDVKVVAMDELHKATSKCLKIRHLNLAFTIETCHTV